MSTELLYTLQIVILSTNRTSSQSPKDFARLFANLNRLKILIGSWAKAYSGVQPGFQTLVAPPPTISPDIGSCFGNCDGVIPL